MGLDGLDDESIQVWDVPQQTQLVNLDVGAAEETPVLSPLAGTIETYSLRNGKMRNSIRVKEGLPGVLSPDLRWAAACFGRRRSGWSIRSRSTSRPAF
jgi:hypothetical protein